VPEPLFLLMVRVKDDPSGMSSWAAVKVQRIGRKLTRTEAEAAAAHLKHPVRFLLRFGEEREKFADDDRPRTLAMLPGETIWNYGEPLRADLLAALKAAAGRPNPDGAEWPNPDMLPVPVATVVGVAVERFGPADAHDIEVRFDVLVADFGGFRHGEPPCYHVPPEAIGTIQLRPKPEP